MWDFFRDQIFGPFTSWVWTLSAFLLTNATAVVGFILALIIMRRVISEKRSPGNFFAWFFLVVFFPIFGVPLYFIFGGRKSRRTIRIKKEILKESQALATGQKEKTYRAHDILAYEAGTTTTGNHFELLPDGEATFDRLCREIDQAETCIHITTYILSDDPVGRALVDRLVQRASTGVKVRLLLDSLGSWNRTRRARYRIRKAGGQVSMFMPVLPLQTYTSSNLRNHRKIAIFDNYRAISGGQNLDGRFIGPGRDPKRFTDFSVVTQGPAVAELTRTFLSDWAFAAKESPSQLRQSLRYVPEDAGDSTIEVIASGPDIDSDPLWEQILRIIQEFRQKLTIITPYFIPDDVLFQSLIVKAHTGRHIQLILPLKSNHPITDIARYDYLRRLHAAGVEILFYQPKMLHAKLILADGKVALVGSANIDMRSLFVNFEIALLHYSPPDIAKLQAWADALVKDCINFEKATANKKMMPSKFSEELVHLIAPLL